MVFRRGWKGPGEADLLKGSAGRGGAGREPVAWSGSCQIPVRASVHQTEMIGNDGKDCGLVKYNSFNECLWCPEEARSLKDSAGRVVRASSRCFTFFFFYSTGFLDWFDSVHNGSHSIVLQTAARSGYTWNWQGRRSAKRILCTC